MHQANFISISKVVQESYLFKVCNAVDGVLFDLGVSSHQIDTASRGFSFDNDGALDMRMDKSQILDASYVVNKLSGDDIANILYCYGDITRSRMIANEIIASRPILTTKQLRDTIISRFSEKYHNKILAQCFQAIRIYVNAEMESLETVLAELHGLVKRGGRMVVLSYHSLEDRRVKRLIKTNSPTPPSPSPSLFSPLSSSYKYNSDSDLDDGGDINDKIAALTKNKKRTEEMKPLKYWMPLFKTPLSPSKEEVKKNSRARSAKLRVAERV